MRSVAKRRFPVILIILIALGGIALSVAVGHVIAARAQNGGEQDHRSRFCGENF